MLRAVLTPAAAPHALSWAEQGWPCETWGSSAVRFSWCRHKGLPLLGAPGRALMRGSALWSVVAGWAEPSSPSTAGSSRAAGSPRAESQHPLLPGHQERLQPL